MAGIDTISQMFLLWRDHLARVVSRIVPPHDIEDIVQETYVRFCQFKSGEEIRSPGAFMTKIARNLAIDHIKRADFQLRSRMDEDVEIEFDELGCLIDEPFNQVASREEFAHFCEAVRNLPLQCRRVFVMKKVYNYSQREIARELDLSENTVEKHIAEGLKRCTVYMRQYYETDNSYRRKWNRVSRERER
jgi:RNA polymerase sigma factor (sigma-70 family)